MTRLKYRTPCTALLLIVTAACSSTYQGFRPAEKTLTETPDGTPAAIYDLRVESQLWGDVRVWSNGAETRDVGGQERTVVHVGFETRNTGADTLAFNLAHTQLEAIQAGARAIASIAPTTTTGDPQTPAHTVGHLDFEFNLPDGVTPGDLQSFRIHWWLHGPGERAFEQYTAFVPHRIYYYYRPYYWYGWYYGPSGWYWCF